MSLPLGDTTPRSVLAAAAALARRPTRRGASSLRCRNQHAVRRRPRRRFRRRCATRTTLRRRRAVSGAHHRVQAACPRRWSMTPVPERAGTFPGGVDRADKPGLVRRGGDCAARQARSSARDVLTFQRMDGVAENFHTEQNRDLLETLASQTGGRYWRPQDLREAAAGDFLFRSGNHAARDTSDLWNMPVVFLAAAGCCAAASGCCAGSGAWYEARAAAALASLLRLLPVRGRRRALRTAITSRWRAWAASRTTSSDSLRWPRIWIGCSRQPDATHHVVTLAGDEATRAHLTEALQSVADQAQAGGSTSC